MIKVFEAFSGYGSQRMALRNLGIPHEIVGISEIDGDAILSYALIHENLRDKREQEIELQDYEIREYLKKINVPLNYRNFESRVDNLRGQKLIDMYLANKLSKNFGDIRRIQPENLPDFDFFTYSFPCQDISIAGYGKGLASNSGTRSSLLWECQKIIENKKPKYLMMENVKNLIGKKHIHNFNKFLEYLENLGYKNYWKVLDARNYGIPQSRKRVFCISILNSNENFTFPEKQDLTMFMDDLLELQVEDNFFLNNNQTTNNPINQEYIYCLDSNYWKGTTLEGFLNKKRRQLVSGNKNSEGRYPARRLTPRETWRFMGVNDHDFNNASLLVSNTQLYRQSGNSIVVSVLELIFKELFNKYI